MSDPASAFGAPVLCARIRTEPEDFRVDEVIGFPPSGSGEHLWLEIIERGCNTAWVAQRLARWAEVPLHAVGYAGLKDRHAVTRQVFTVHLPRRVAPDFAALEAEPGIRVLAQAWHSRKLPRGALRGNRFGLRLRAVQGERGAIESRLATLAARGVPNYFGAQRFGRDGGNLAAARAMFAGRRVARERRGILLSAARSALFNAVLAERVRRGVWDRALPGEVWMLDGSHSIFGPQPLDDTLVERAAAGDIHPTGPLWGRGDLRCSEDCAALELASCAPHGDLRNGLEQAGLRQERRALRLRVTDLEYRWEEDALLLDFFLPAGSYATVVLDALGRIEDVGGAAQAPGPEYS